MKIQKFNEKNVKNSIIDINHYLWLRKLGKPIINEDITGFLIENFNLEDDCIGYKTRKESKYYELSFLFESINIYNVNNINKMKKFIENINNFEIKKYKDDSYKAAVDISFYLSDINFKKLENKIEILLNTKEYNL